MLYKKIRNLIAVLAVMIALFSLFIFNAAYLLRSCVQFYHDDRNTALLHHISMYQLFQNKFSAFGFLPDLRWRIHLPSSLYHIEFLFSSLPPPYLSAYGRTLPYGYHNTPIFWFPPGQANILINAGCDDTVHPIFLFVSICVLPQQLYGQISRKHLSVMGMTAKLCIHSGISQFLQLSRLMLQHDDRLAFIDILRDFFRCLSLRDTPSRSFVIRSAIKIYAAGIDPYAFLLQSVIPPLHKGIHPRIALLFLILSPKGKSRQDRLLDIVIACR